MQNYYNNSNQSLKEQLTGININQKYRQKDKTNILIQVFKEEIDFLIFPLKVMIIKQVTINIFFPTIEIKGYNVMIFGQKFLIERWKITEEHMTVFEKLHQVKEMITQLVVC